MGAAVSCHATLFSTLTLLPEDNIGPSRRQYAAAEFSPHAAATLHCCLRPFSPLRYCQPATPLTPCFSLRLAAAIGCQRYFASFKVAAAHTLLLAILPLMLISRFSDYFNIFCCQRHYCFTLSYAHVLFTIAAAYIDISLIYFIFIRHIAGYFDYCYCYRFSFSFRFCRQHYYASTLAIDIFTTWYCHYFSIFSLHAFVTKILRRHATCH